MSQVENRLEQKINDLAMQGVSTRQDILSEIGKVHDKLVEVSMALSDEDEELTHRIERIEDHLNLPKTQ